MVSVTGVGPATRTCYKPTDGSKKPAVALSDAVEASPRFSATSGGTALRNTFLALAMLGGAVGCTTRTSPQVQVRQPAPEVQAEPAQKPQDARPVEVPFQFKALKD